MKRAIITLLLALVAMAGQAKVYKTIKAPKAMALDIFRGELKEDGARYPLHAVEGIY